MKSYLNKLLTIISLICLFALTACGTSYKVDGEEEAEKIYTCPADNMFGLEKIVVFEDRVIAVFDKEISDDSIFPQLAYSEMTGVLPAGVRLSNYPPYIEEDNTLEEKDGKYIVTMSFEYDEANKINPEKKVEVTGFGVCGRNVFFNNGDLQLLYTFEGGDCFEDYRQEYSESEGEWGELQNKYIETPAMEFDE